MSKTKWLAVAELIDALRIFPRLMLIGYGLWAWYAVDRMMQFYFDLPSDDKASVAVAGFCTLVIGAVTGFAAPIFRIYQDSARNWESYNAGKGTVTETLATSKTVTPPGVTAQ